MPHIIASEPARALAQFPLEHRPPEPLAALAKESDATALSDDAARCRGGWVEEFLRFHRQRTGRWIHPQELGKADVEAFLTHLAVNRCVAQSTQNQALGAILFLHREESRFGRE